MRAYRLHGLNFVLDHDLGQPPKGLERLLYDLNLVAVADTPAVAALRLSVRASPSPVTSLANGRETLSVDGFRGEENGDDFLLTDGASSLRVNATSGKAEAHLAPTFFQKPSVLQRNFWAFALTKLLRGRGVFALHGAALVSPQGEGLLIVASPGSGKSTLAIGLIRRGWGYLSDDAVLLRREGPRVIALALRKHFMVDCEARERYADLHPQAVGGAPTYDERYSLDVHRVFPAQYVPVCIPGTVLFPRIEGDDCSGLEPLGAASATKLLLKESGPQLFDRVYMPAHLELLRTLVGQCDLFRLRAGADLYVEPGALETLLQSVAE